MTPRRAGFSRSLPRSPRASLSVSAPLLLAALLALLVSPFARAQQTPPNPAADADEIVRVETNLITLPVFVTDKAGRRAHGLTAEDFRLFDNASPAGISYFAAGAERVALLFLIDASGSTRQHITQQREAARALFQRFGQRSRVAVLRFAEEAEVVVPFTTEQSRIDEAFIIPAQANARTAIFDGARRALRVFDRTSADATERRIVIIISDGLDTVSRSTAAEVVREATARNVSFYVLHLPLYTPREGRLQPRPAARGFRDLAEKTGGQFFMVGDARASLDPRARYDFTPIFQAIADDLAGQYVLGFYAGEAARHVGEHRLAVNLATPEQQRRLRVRSLRTSYTLGR